MEERFIPQMEPWFDEREKLAINEYMEEGGWLTEFKRTAKFEQMISEYTGAKFCVVVNNGTISLTLAARLTHRPRKPLIATITTNAAKAASRKPVTESAMNMAVIPAKRERTSRTSNGNLPKGPSVTVSEPGCLPATHMSAIKLARIRKKQMIPTG